LYAEFRELLETATGRSEHVIVVNLDIRGFSSFCRDADSLNVATYITRVYAKILNNYFKDMSFFKPTGDGLIMTFPYNSQNLKERANEVVEICLNLVNDFPTLVRNDPMINFETPERIGIGISRGSACCIKSGEKVLDYSGRVLNLASRLMDMARPSGIVIDERFRINLLKDDYSKLFADEKVYVRGITTNKPLIVHYLIKDTIIPPEYKIPPVETEFITEDYKISFKKLKGMIDIGGRNFVIWIDQTPLDEKRVIVNFCVPDPKFTEYQRIFPIESDNFKIGQIGGRYQVLIKIKKIRTCLKNIEIEDDPELTFEISYPVKQSG
jgi:class 3 adenylate cyclase